MAFKYFAFGVLALAFGKKKKRNNSRPKKVQSRVSSNCALSPSPFFVFRLALPPLPLRKLDLSPPELAFDDVF